MKKQFLFLAVGAMVIASCTNDEFMDDSMPNQQTSKEYLDFNVKVGNPTRATAQDANHYEFGVFALKGSKQSDPSTSTVMDNYLVAWGGNALYSALADKGTTFGDAAQSADGLSLWFYENLSPTNKTAYTMPDNTQVLKFWDKSIDHTYFYAYAPYASKSENSAVNPDKVVYTENTLTFGGLSAFYTSPAATTSKHQVITANTASASASGMDYDKEMINYNEGLYAFNDVSKGNYGKDVTLNFAHINARLNIAFYHTVPGYDIEITEMVPDEITITGSTSANKTTKVQNGIVLTPATEAQAFAIAQTAKSDLPEYYEKATVKVSNIDGTPTINVGADGDATVSSNLYFQKTSGNVATSGSSSATKSATTLYVLPNYSGSSYITNATDASVTGYTLHVSYKLKPKDGSAAVQVYDARVFVPAEKCRWEAGKAYTYIFKITDASTGTTDPTKIDPDPDKQDPTDQEPWVDPDDNRVDTDPALMPIVFDNLIVTDYDVTSQYVVPDFQVSSYTWHKDASTTFYMLAQPALQTSVAGVIQNPTSVLPIGQMAYNATFKRFEFNDGATVPAVVGRFAAQVAGIDEAYAFFWSATSGKAFKLTATKGAGDVWTCSWGAEADYGNKAFSVFTE